MHLEEIKDMMERGEVIGQQTELGFMDEYFLCDDGKVRFYGDMGIPIDAGTPEQFKRNVERGLFRFYSEVEGWSAYSLDHA